MPHHPAHRSLFARLAAPLWRLTAALAAVPAWLYAALLCAALARAAPAAGPATAGLVLADIDQATLARIVDEVVAKGAVASAGGWWLSVLNAVGTGGAAVAVIVVVRMFLARQKEDAERLDGLLKTEADGRATLLRTEAESRATLLRTEAEARAAAAGALRERDDGARKEQQGLLDRCISVMQQMAAALHGLDARLVDEQADRREVAAEQSRNFNAALVAMQAAILAAVAALQEELRGRRRS